MCHFIYKITREYKATVEPLQKALVDKQSPEKVQIMQCCLVVIIFTHYTCHHFPLSLQVLLHLTHPKDEIAIQVLGFLDVLLYQGNRDVQINISELICSLNFEIFPFVGESVTSYKDVTFFKRISKLLENVISSFGKPQVW